MTAPLVLDLNTDHDHVEENSAGVIDRLLPVDKVLKNLRSREKDRLDFLASSVNQPNRDGNITLDWQGKEKGRDGGFFVMKHPDIGPDAIPLADTAVTTACKSMRTSWGYFQQFENPESEFVSAFKKTVNHRNLGLVVRTGTSGDGINRKVEAIVPSNFDRTSDAEIFESMLGRLKQDYDGQIRGVQVLQDGSRGTHNYRVLFGEPKLVEDPRDPMKAALTMLSFTSSEIGMVDSKVALGLYRLICRNGVMRVDWEGGIARWNRRNGANNFMSKIGEVIGNAGHFAAFVSERLNNSWNTPLAAPGGGGGREILFGIGNQGLITSAHFKSAEKAADHSPLETEYDMLNLLTSSAKSLNPLTRRQDGESAALRLAMQPGGFSGVLVNGFSKDTNHNDLKAIIPQS